MEDSPQLANTGKKSSSSGELQGRDSNFSLSNAADINFKNHQVTPLKEDGNIDAIECGKSSEGVSERNNPFEQHGYTHYVDNEEKPSQPKKAIN